MSAQRASAPVRLARLAAAVALVALAAVVAARLAGRRGGPAPSPAAPPPPPAEIVDLQERVRQQEFKDGRAVADIRGERFFRGPDGRNHLEGGIEFAGLGPAGEVVSRLTADAIAYDPGSLVFTVSGHVRVEAGEVVLEGESFEYDKPAGTFGTKSGGRFSSKTLSGGAPEISFSEKADEVRLGGGFAAEIAASDDGKDRLALAGDTLRYVRGERKGRIEGRASIRGADHAATAGAIAFVAAADEAGLDSAVLEDVPVVSLQGKEPSSAGEIRAQRIEITFSGEPSGLAIQASGAAVLSTRSGQEGGENVAASSILFNLDRKNGSWVWEARGGIRAELTEAGGGRRAVEGDRAWFDGGRVLHVAGSAGRPAVADSAEARLESNGFAIAAGSGDLLATGGVTGVIKKGEEGRKIGFFSLDDDVSVSCRVLQTRSDVRVTFLTGAVVLRQGGVIVRGDEIELAGDAGRMSGSRAVVTLTEDGAEGRPGRTIELAGRAMAYRPDTTTLTVTEKASLVLPDARLDAGAISAVVGRDGRTVETLEAKTAVVVARGRYVGRSEAASYVRAADRIALTGRPVLTDDKGGSARGAKLTFDLADDKIFIENEGSGRATTVVRS